MGNWKCPRHSCFSSTQHHWWRYKNFWMCSTRIAIPYSLKFLRTKNFVDAFSLPEWSALSYKSGLVWRLFSTFNCGRKSDLHETIVANQHKRNLIVRKQRWARAILLNQLVMDVMSLRITSHHLSAEYYLVKKKVGMQLLQCTYFSLFIGGEVFVTPTTVTASACVTTWHVTIIFQFQELATYFLVCIWCCLRKNYFRQRAIRDW